VESTLSISVLTKSAADIFNHSPAIKNDNDYKDEELYQAGIIIEDNEIICSSRKIIF
ncbi:19593_t:CDS:1, partial [Funneliformis geosporum]